MAAVIIIPIILGIVIVILTVIIIKDKKHRNNLEKENIVLHQKVDDKNDTIKKILDERSNGSENRIIELDQRIEEKQDELLKVTTKIDEYENDLNSIAIALYSLNSTYQDTVVEYQGVIQSRDDILALQKSCEEALAALKPQIKELEAQLKELSERKRLALLNQEEYQEGMNEFSITPKENELISILERIKMDYPDLKTDFANIEWRKIWLPKLQDLCNRIGGNNKGIYRLILKSDKNICYVGQAVNIQDRWYQHVKKMIGVDTKGNEKLYNYRPEDFYWTIVELNPKDINAAEHYWIEYFGCKEIGLNKKA